LLRMRICDLKLKIPGTELEPRIENFYRELAAKGISFKPVCYLSNEWFCPEGSATIAIPFYLAHPRLKKLEEKMMLEIEGGTESWCMRLLRHEMGHVLNHTFLLEKDRHWQKLFGSPSLEYSESFRARPYSKRFVRHLEGWYAQSHPEEDFPDFFDADLKRLFTDASAAPDNERAAVFLRRSSKMILNAVSTWTGETKFTLYRLLRALTERCADLDLRLRAESAGVEVSAYLATLASHYRLTGKFKDT